jgi:hypothetical protein
MAVAVCFEPKVAAALTAAGIPVVLCASDATVLDTAVLDAAVASAGRRPAGGRVALFVADPAGDPVTAESQAQAMAAELFGPGPVVVRTPAGARALVASLPAEPDPDSGTVDSFP